MCACWYSRVLLFLLPHKFEDLLHTTGAKTLKTSFCLVCMRGERENGKGESDWKESEEEKDRGGKRKTDREERKAGETERNTDEIKRAA